jgi:ribosomal protein S3
MGHLTHAIGFRVGKSIPWAFRAHRYDFDAMQYLNLYSAYDAYVKKSFYAGFNGVAFKLLYSHIGLRPYRRFLRLSIYMFNGFLDIYIRRFRLTVLPKVSYFWLKTKYARFRSALTLNAFYRNSVRYRQLTTFKYYKAFSRFLMHQFRYDFRNVSFMKNKYYPMYIRFVHLSFRTITAKVLGNYIIRRLKLGYSINSVVKPLITEVRKTSSFKGIFVKFKGRLTRKQRASYNKRILKFGKIGFSTVMEKVDYAYTRYITRYGSCSIKIWLCRRLPRNIYRTLSFKGRGLGVIKRQGKKKLRVYHVKNTKVQKNRNANALFVKYVKRLTHKRLFNLTDWRLLLFFLVRRKYQKLYLRKYVA